MIQLFCGYDPREAVGYHTFCHSVVKRATAPVNFTPLSSMGLPQGSNTFTLSRFLVPYLMGFQGHAIFCDASDMLMLADIAELDALYDPTFAVQVVKHEYQTRHKMKYMGTEMQCPNRDYSRKNWASVMLINCAHEDWRTATPESIASTPALEWLQFKNIADVGAIPAEWNCLVDEGQDSTNAKLLHWTAGIPCFPMYANAPRAEDWNQAHKEMLYV